MLAFAYKGWDITITKNTEMVMAQMIVSGPYEDRYTRMFQWPIFNGDSSVMEALGQELIDVGRAIDKMDEAKPEDRQAIWDKLQEEPR